MLIDHKLTADERKWLNTISHEQQPLQLVVLGRRGEVTTIVESLEELDEHGGVSNDTIMGKVYAHVREVQAMEAPDWGVEEDEQ